MTKSGDSRKQVAVPENEGLPNEANPVTRLGMVAMLKRKVVAVALGLLLSGLSGAGVGAEDGESGKPAVVVGLVCTWSAYSVNKESLLIDVTAKAVYWVNENQKLQVLQFNSGRIVMAGVRSVLQVSQSQAEKKVPMEMTIDRISGEFLVRQNVYAYQGPGNCRKQRLF